MSSKLIILLVLIAAGLGAVGFHMQTSRKYLLESTIEPRIVLAFTNWAASHQKLYKNPTEKSYRLRIFMKTLLTIEAHNTNSRKTWTMGLNSYSDLNSEEYLALLEKKPQLSSYDAQSGMPADLYPESSNSEAAQETPINWSNYLQQFSIDQTSSYCTQISYAWIAAITLNAQYRIFKNQTSGMPEFSAQNLVDCSNLFGNYGCNGGTVESAYDYVRFKGIATGISPSISDRRTCPGRVEGFKVSGYKRVAHMSNTDLYNTLASKNLISSLIDLSYAQNYKDGVFTGPCSNNPTSNVLIYGAGYDTFSGLKFWNILTMNPTSWGNYGRMYLVRFSQDDTPNYSSCGLNIWATYPYYAN